jgi:hypothetical protein
MTPILLLEGSEVPWRLIDRVASAPTLPRLIEFFRALSHHMTLAVDAGELSPWVLWPTFHGGIANERTGIKVLRQDPATFGGGPIWKSTRKQQVEPRTGYYTPEGTLAIL